MIIGLCSKEPALIENQTRLHFHDAFRLGPPLGTYFGHGIAVSVRCAKALNLGCMLNRRKSEQSRLHPGLEALSCSFSSFDVLLANDIRSHDDALIRPQEVTFRVRHGG